MYRKQGGEIEIEMYWEERKVHREVRMTLIWIQILNARITLICQQREYFIMYGDWMWRKTLLFLVHIS